MITYTVLYMLWKYLVFNTELWARAEAFISIKFKETIDK